MLGSVPKELTCLHLIHTVEEVIWSAGDAITAHTQAAVCAFITGVVGPTADTQGKGTVTFSTEIKAHLNSKLAQCYAEIKI